MVILILLYRILKKNSAGLVKIGAYQINNPGLSGNVVIANVTLKAVGDQGSTSPLDIIINELKDATPDGNAIQHTIINGTFTVTSSAEPTPTPTQTPSNGGGSSGGGGSYVPPIVPTPTPAPTEKPPAVEKALQTINSIEAGKTESVTFVGLDVCKISIEVDKNVSNVEVMVETVDKPEEIAEAPAPGIVYSCYNITATNLTEANVTAKIEFKVNRSWITNEHVDEAKITLNRYEEDGRWKMEDMSYI